MFPQENLRVRVSRRERKEKCLLVRTIDQQESIDLSAKTQRGGQLQTGLVHRPAQAVQVGHRFS